MYRRHVKAAQSDAMPVPGWTAARRGGTHLRSPTTHTSRREALASAGLYTPPAAGLSGAETETVFSATTTFHVGMSRRMCLPSFPPG